jgi:gluconolactonase
MAVVVIDKRLLDLVDEDVKVEKIATGYTFVEGPVWHARERHLTFSDIYDDHGGTMYRWTEKDGAQILRRPSNRANGNTYDRQGRLVTCEHGRRVVRMDAGGNIEVVVDRFEGKRLNSPNDVICLPNGDLLFTDPTFGLRQPDGSIAGQEYDFAGVFRYSSADGSLKPLLRDIGAPNGLAMTDDGRTFYVCDTRERVVRAWDVDAEGNLSNGRVVCRTEHGDARGGPDGMKLDSQGNIYVAANSADGIWVFAPEGTLLGMIGTGEEQNRLGTGPGGPANLAWGDDDWQTIYATAVTSVYRLRMKVPGQPVVIE